ncbi:peptidase M24 [Thermocrinis albus DSM 14484]|uniref:Peptidase M24 n=1 Tax=Thermocrinis albus (strain DSM 14484 / JCM 11386 / HI 11/12) TaxID=638303 RepID=D3SLK0_THEAH|nr:Xaa-Pro peptidase family protein [Thermocrinis albus]ADC89630.1 peptidase M24 [Thermocrinis albus DSM 14484]
MKDILGKVKNLVVEKDLDGFLFSSQANVFYLSRFRSSNAYVLLTQGDAYFMTDGRYYHRAKDLLKDWKVLEIRGSFFGFLKQMVRELGLRRVGFEIDRVTCQFRKKLRTKDVRWVGFVGFLDRVRAVKTSEEISIMKEGVLKADGIYRDVLSIVKPGMKEMDIRAFIVQRAFEVGATGESFPAIVAFGEGSSIPHWETSHRTIGDKGPLLIDMGILYKGYCTDFTRTIHIGKPDEEFIKVYTVVRDAHMYALEKAKVGNRLADVDRAARDHITRKGLGKFFNHSTGHGVGVEIHEYPRVYKNVKDYIEEGMVFTIEPGVYLPGKWGVRLENIVVVKSSSAEPLSEISLDLVII